MLIVQRVMQMAMPEHQQYATIVIQIITIRQAIQITQHQEFPMIVLPAIQLTRDGRLPHFQLMAIIIHLPGHMLPSQITVHHAITAIITIHQMFVPAVILLIIINQPIQTTYP